MKSVEIREAFLQYFESKGHARLPSSSLIPAADPTLLFTNAGMVQFKDYFLGLKTAPSSRATTAQKCVRAGGKHNDLENVGFTARHHTFFEMMGNFSFGNYFKKEAIEYAWEFLTSVLSIPQDRLWITVFETDDEAFELWKAIGVPENRIHRLGEKDNFWAMGDTGPCGPCTEIHYDWGTKVGSGKADAHPGNDDLRFLEIWNLVFMQYNRDSNGKMTPLPKPSVDTGAGLERLACVLQGEFNNYDTDLFHPIIEAIALKTQTPYRQNENTDVSLRVVADHLRSCSFLMSDGVVPSNEGRGYVLRRILRRAIRHGKKLGKDEPFLFQLVQSVIDSLGHIYPDLASSQEKIRTLFLEEEERFHVTLHKGLGLLEDSITKIKSEKGKALTGDVAFKLYDTFGFPLDLTSVICEEHGLKVDTKDFEKRMQEQRSKSSWSKDSQAGLLENIHASIQESRPDTAFSGYQSTQLAGSKLLKVLDEKGHEVEQLNEGNSGYLIFNKTPFYAESGGQAGDRGIVEYHDNQAEVETTFKVSTAFLHKVTVKNGNLTKGSAYDLKVNASRRLLTAINHTSTHLLHAALRLHLGERVTQAGSLVDANHLRFDFTYPRGLSAEELRLIEKEVNDSIQRSEEVSVETMPKDEAIASGAMAFFDEKYGDEVRVIRVGDQDKPFSIELCGGTHLDNTIQAGFFKIKSETSIASGTRRIEALTSFKAIEFLNNRNQELEQIERQLDLASKNIPQKLDSLISENKKLKNQNEKLQVKAAQANSQGGSGGALWEKKKAINGLSVVIEQVQVSDPKILRTLVDQIRDKLKSKTIVALATNNDSRVSICVGVSKDLLETYDAGKLIKGLAADVGGKGGGRKDFAQAGGTEPTKIKTAFANFEKLLGAQ